MTDELKRRLDDLKRGEEPIDYGFAKGMEPDISRRVLRMRTLPPELESSLKREQRTPATPMLTFDILSLVSVYVPLHELAERTLAEREAACDWAGAVHLQASDNDDVEIPERPEWLPGRDSASWNADESKFAHAFDQYGGYDAAYQKYHADWKDPENEVEDPGEELSDDAAAMLDILETVEDLRYKLRTLLGLPTEGYTRDDTSVAAQSSSTEQQHGNDSATAGR